jgi:hypothetical protein
VFGPILVIVGFFLCLFLSQMICRTTDACGPLKFGMPATLGVIIFLIAVAVLKSQLGTP